MAQASPAISIPHLETARLRLREFRFSDFDAFASNAADPLAMVHIPVIVERAKAFSGFCACTGSWLLGFGGWWGVELRESGAYVGVVGAFFRQGEGDLELGWTLQRAHWRHGYAKEAARAALDFGLAHHGVSRAIAHIHHENEASQKVAQSLGMKFERDAELHGQKLGLWALGV